jgi:osmotically-inducible protein OsmY
MKSDTAIKRNVETELSWNPEIDATDIAVNVHSGVAPGVTNVRNELTVRT